MGSDSSGHAHRSAAVFYRVFKTWPPLYGHQEGAELGYNPHKPGRPSHTYHSFLIANLRLVLDVEVQAGNQTASKHSSPGLWALLERLGRENWPAFIDQSPPGLRWLELMPDGTIHSGVERLADTPVELDLHSTGY